MTGTLLLLASVPGIPLAIVALELLVIRVWAGPLRPQPEGEYDYWEHFGGGGGSGGSQLDCQE